MSKTTLVSVIIPTFNRENSIKAAISSCLGQTYKNIEIIVVDDASRDNTQGILSSFNDARIKFFHHNTNKGPAATRNTGLRNTKGDFIAFLDSDDEWMPEKIEKQLTAFNLEAKQSGLIFTNGYNEAEEKYFIPEDTNSGIIYDPVKDTFFPLRILITPPSSWLIPLEVIRDTGYFDESMYNWDDGDYFVRIAYKFPVYFLNDNLVIWHASKHHVNVISPKLIEGKQIFLEKNYSHLKNDRGYLFNFYRTMGKDLLKIDKTKSKEYFLQAFKLKPFNLNNLGKIIKIFLNN